MDSHRNPLDDLSASLPGPLSAAVGLLSVTTEQARQLPQRAVRLPAAGWRRASALVTEGSAVLATVLGHHYDQLAGRGQELAGRARSGPAEAPAGSAPAEAPVEARPEGPGPVRRRTGGARSTTARPGGARSTTARPGAPAARRRLRQRAGETADTVADRLESAAEALAGGATLAGQADRTERDADNGEPAETMVPRLVDPPPAPPAGESLAELATKADQADRELAARAGDSAPTPSRHRPDTAATADVQQEVARISGQTTATSAELPIDDFDHVTVGSLRGRLRRLDTPGLVALRDYEKAHADRLAIVTMLDNRIARLASGRG